MSVLVERVDADDVARMRSELFFDGETRREKLSRFWLLLTLAAVIASAGVIADSTATVIGAMIVAPLMTPILGMALAATLVDRENLFRSIGLVVAGVAAVVGIGWLLGVATAIPVEAATNSQVAGRVAPRLIDLVAALATGAVGAIALSRSDISDTLPGVAIAISLVPPLAVVGLTLEAGAASEAAGAFLLFVTNVTAILAMGTLVMALYGVPAYAVAERRKGVLGRGVVIGLMVAIVAVPLAITSRHVTLSAIRESGVREVALAWAGESGWDLAQVTSRSDHILVRAAGPLPAPAVDALEAALASADLDDVRVVVELVPGTFAVIESGR